MPRPSRKLRLAALGATSGLGAGFARALISDHYVASTVGGAVAGIAVNQLLDLGFGGAVLLAFHGAVSGWAGARLSEAFTDGVGEPAPVRSFTGLALGGAAGALSLQSLAPAEFLLVSS